MITRLEATNYRCFERLGVDVGDFCVVVGANGCGKSTLLDLPSLLGELLRAPNVVEPFLEGHGDLPPRAGGVDELVFAGHGKEFSFAVEARLPEDIQAKVLEGMCAWCGSAEERLALRQDSNRWPSHLRYELGFQISERRELLVSHECLFAFSESDGVGRSWFTQEEGVLKGRLFLRRGADSAAVFTPECPSQPPAVLGSVKVADLPATMLAMPRVLYESEPEYPAARWLHKLLTADSVFFEPDWRAMRQPSPPGQPKRIIASGRNMPWLALGLMREGAPPEAGKDYRSERYADWIAHVRTALPQIADIGVWEREDDHHAYFTVRYRGGHTVRSSGLSEGTLRILTLTLLPYLRSQPGILVTEEPENGIHPRAVEAMMQSLSSIYGSQVWISSHSPVVLAGVDPAQLLCASLNADGAVEIVRGSEHPRLQEWGGAIDLGSIFAAGVLG